MLRKISDILFGKKITSAVADRMPQMSRQYRYKLIEREYIERESEVGARLFGPIPSGHQRQFFCLDRHTWVWHEMWEEEKGVQTSFTVTYEVRNDGIFKRVNGGQYSKLQGAELANFDRAIRGYYEQVVTKVYDRQIATA